MTFDEQFVQIVETVLESESQGGSSERSRRV
ncbi:hypothetical protein ZOD2009_16096 [Haladaptatus paucihalophilus DX253]|uniref:Uncharacterized protein n=1 Tax=Haladaptatus paucihalophilus DX253 TaxID=797209 RepID=E7QWN1_HALPU|nr:hypothetical protein ZOD2009_16096 [Haladaptatus paucihalophilus DX253]